jgi:hypothetical protein
VGAARCRVVLRVVSKGHSFGYWLTVIDDVAAFVRSAQRTRYAPRE